VAITSRLLLFYPRLHFTDVLARKLHAMLIIRRSGSKVVDGPKMSEPLNTILVEKVTYTAPKSTENRGSFAAGSLWAENRSL